MKIKRQSKIIDLIKSYDIETQEELTQKLSEAGFYVTQATVSRDIRELKLTKITGENGMQKYAVMSSVSKQYNERFLRIFRDGVVSLNFAQNLIIIHTLVGMAQAVGACIDALNSAEIIGSEILGSIAGDDCIFCATKSEEDAIMIISKFKEVLNSRE